MATIFSDIHSLDRAQLMRLGGWLVTYGLVGVAVGCSVVTWIVPSGNSPSEVFVVSMVFGLLSIGFGSIAAISGAYLLALGRWKMEIESFYRLAGKILWATFACGVGVWLIFSFAYAPYSRDETLDTNASPASQRLRDSAYRMVVLFDDSSVRVEFLKGFNINVYIRREKFESVPFPDREDYVSAAGRVWCSSIEQAFFPAVTVKDIRNGDTLASYSCTLKRTSLADLNGWFR